MNKSEGKKTTIRRYLGVTLLANSSFSTSKHQDNSFKLLTRLNASVAIDQILQLFQESLVQ
jgi:hypothetical protein